MSPQNRRSSPSKYSRATAKWKRTSGIELLDENDNQTKRRTVTVTETLNRRPDPFRNLLTSNRFKSIRPPKNRHRGRKRKHDGVADDVHREWTVSPLDFSNFKDKFVMVSYNILGVENALKHPELYHNVPREILKWERRKKVICKEITSYNTSILCLQEVDHFGDLDDLLRMDGFTGVYKAKTGDACDGCAIFWKEKLFTLLHHEDIEFQNYDLHHNVAQLCILKMNRSLSESTEETSVAPVFKSQNLVVGNIHLLFNPKRGDIKLGQIRLFLEKAYKLSQEWGGIPVLLAGDLNSCPRSALYQFLASSELDVSQHDRKHISGQFELPSKCRDRKFRNRTETSDQMSISRTMLYRWSDMELKLATGCEGVTQLQHRLNLRSAYHGVPGSCSMRDSHGEPLATSCHSQFKGTVDYIWHTGELLPVRVLETLPIKILKKSGGLPSERWGSDHLALVCELAFAKNDGA